MFAVTCLFLACSKEDADSSQPPLPGDSTPADSAPVDTGSAEDSGLEGDSDAAGDSGETGSAEDSGAAGDSGSPAHPVPEWGATPSLTLLADASQGLDTPRDLAWHPEREELWVLNRYGLSGPLDGGSITIVFSAGESDQSEETRVDAYAYHFMDEASSIAFGGATFEKSSELTFATCQESRNDYGGTSRPNDFMGPTLWPSDLDLFALTYQGHPDLLGSHLDMLHQSPLCMGIAWERDNVYWVVDGAGGTIVRYDFATDHGMGEHDHSDGIVREFRELEIQRVEDTPSHLAIEGDWLYIVDSGNARILRLDTQSGSFAEALQPNGEMLAEFSRYEGATYEQLISEGLTLPSGLAIHEGRLFVGDAATGEVVAYSMEDFSELGRLETGATMLAGLDVGPDGHLYYVDTAQQQLLRVDPG